MPVLIVILAIIIAAITGMTFSVFHAIASVNLKADQTISGTALNMFAPAFAIFIARIVNKTLIDKSVQEEQYLQFLIFRLVH